ncbi:hypothetical protein [Desulfofundulus salinus]|uniref:Uncharacterized protein n=1 Tax=Desulfofundulus salinus TaxID=2419843 RepID=A0A494WS75_9FIRM|nr:hypothetical protein [Desulfofundulus salinum]RKO65681.1 hypothetical protein D7024_00995 [Desulfofundulus salinum]
MREKDHRPISRLSAFTVVLLIISLIANIHLWVSRPKASAHADLLAEGYAKILSGYMNGLKEQLDSAKGNDWADANQLWSISSVIQVTEVRALSILDLNPLLDRKIGNEISKSRLPDLWPDLRQTSLDFNNAAANRVKGLPVDTRKLENFRVKVKRAKFPNQDTFTWQEFRLAIDRYFGE